MSKIKYVKVANKKNKYLQVIFFVAFIALITILLVRIILENPTNPIVLFFYVEFYFSQLCLVLFVYFYLINWKSKILFAEEDIYETVISRKKTPIERLAVSKSLKPKFVVEIIENLISQNRLSGEIKDGIYSSEFTSAPTCPLCKKPIEDEFIMAFCSYCKRPFHKDHLIDYLNEVKEKCPVCQKTLTLADIIK